MAKRMRSRWVRFGPVLRVTPMEMNGSPVLKLEGKVSGPWVDELQHCWSGVAQNKDQAAVKVDLRGVSYLDSRGRDLLLHMERQGASLVECPDFVRQLLKAAKPGRKTSHK